MGQRTCSILDCDRPYSAHGWCRAHYNRWRRTGEIRPNDPVVTDRSAALYRDAEWCRERFEVDLMTFAEMAQEAQCSIATIFKWIRRHGIRVPTVQQRIKLRGNGFPGGDKIAYQAAHDRVRGVKGRASDWPCWSCGRSAKDWAYDHTDPDEKTWEGNGRRYSLDPSHYRPMCVRCHRRFDLRETTHCKRGHEFDEANTRRRQRRDGRWYRSCRRCERIHDRNRRLRT